MPGQALSLFLIFPLFLTFLLFLSPGASIHAPDLLKAGCTNDDIRDICEGGSLACVNLTITHTNNMTASLLANSSLQPFALSVTHSLPLAVPTALPDSMCYSSSDDDSFVYFISGSQVVGFNGGDFEFAAIALQLRATVDMGALGTAVTLHTTTWGGGSGDSRLPSCAAICKEHECGTNCPMCRNGGGIPGRDECDGCEQGEAKCAAGSNISTITTPGKRATTHKAIVRTSEAAAVTSEWQVQFHGICHTAAELW
eukprot:COSAG06_NODE_12523_length_1369_cov_1.544094_1_plen_255_part_00